MAKFSVELGAMFSEIANKIGEALKSGYKTINDKTEQIKQLREDIRNERTEIGAVENAVVAFATTATQVINGHKQDGESVDNLIDVLDDIEDCVDREVGSCANCGTLLMESDEPYYEDDKVFCDDNCADEYHMIGECDNCGSPIYDRDDYVECEYGIFCNDDCRDEYLAEHNKIGECDYCGAPIYDTDDYVQYAGHLFCNDECHGEFLVKRIGETLAELENTENDTDDDTEENTENDNSDEGDEPEEIYND